MGTSTATRFEDAWIAIPNKFIGHRWQNGDSSNDSADLSQIAKDLQHFTAHMRFIKVFVCEGHSVGSATIILTVTNQRGQQIVLFLDLVRFGFPEDGSIARWILRESQEQEC